MASFRSTTAGKSATTSPVRTPSRPAVRASWAACALAIIVFVGVHPVLTQVPPGGPASITTTRLPRAASLLASGTPACPLPMTMTSVSIRLTSSRLRRHLVVVPRGVDVAVGDLVGAWPRGCSTTFTWKCRVMPASGWLASMVA